MKSDNKHTFLLNNHGSVCSLRVLTNDFKFAIIHSFGFCIHTYVYIIYNTHALAIKCTVFGALHFPCKYAVISPLWFKEKVVQ